MKTKLMAGAFLIALCTANAQANEGEKPLFTLAELEAMQTTYVAQCSHLKSSNIGGLKKAIAASRKAPAKKAVSDAVLMSLDEDKSLYDYGVGFPDCNFAQANLNIARAERYLAVRNEDDPEISYDEYRSVKQMLGNALLARYALNTSEKISDLEAAERLIDDLPSFEEGAGASSIDVLGWTTLFESYTMLAHAARNEGAKPTLEKKAKKILDYAKQAFELYYAPLSELDKYSAAVKAQGSVSLENGHMYDEHAAFTKAQLKFWLGID
jgi:hypothetical protein